MNVITHFVFKVESCDKYFFKKAKGKNWRL